MSRDKFLFVLASLLLVGSFFWGKNILGEPKVDLVKEFKTALKNREVSTQDKILNNIGDNLTFQRFLDDVFKDKKKVLKYIAKRDNINFLKRYFRGDDISGKPERFDLMKYSLSKGSLALIQFLAEKGKVKIVNKDLINNFDAISKIKDLEKIKKFWRFLDSIDLSNLLIRSMIDQRDVFKKNKTLRAFIHFVCLRCNIVWLKFLIDKKVNLDLQDKMRQTPLHLAIQTSYKGTLKKKLEVLKMFKKAGLEILLRDRADKTARDYVKDYIKFYEDKKKKLAIYKSILEEMKNLQRD